MPALEGVAGVGGVRVPVTEKIPNSKLMGPGFISTITAPPVSDIVPGWTPTGTSPVRTAVTANCVPSGRENCPANVMLMGPGLTAWAGMAAGRARRLRPIHTEPQSV